MWSVAEPAESSAHAHEAEPLARAVVAGIAVLVGSAIALGITEGFEVRVLNGRAYWTAWLGRQTP